MPGMSVAPAASMTVAPVGGCVRPPRAMRWIRLPCTRTSPVYGSAPLQSMMRTLVNRTLLMWRLLARSKRGAQEKHNNSFFLDLSGKT